MKLRQAQLTLKLVSRRLELVEKYEVISLRAEKYRILAGLFVRGSLGISGSEIRDILGIAGVEGYGSDAIWQLRKRLKQCNLNIINSSRNNSLASGQNILT